MELALPNLHPAMVHFPIVLIPLALALEAAWAVVRTTALRRIAAGSWGLAATASAAAFLAGRAAADGLVDVPAHAQPHIGDHADWATATLALVLGVAVLRGVAEIRPDAVWGRGVHALGALLGLAASASVFVTADKGGALVYRHAVAVEVPACPTCEPRPARGKPAAVPNEGPVLQEEDGLHTWTPSPASLARLGAESWPERGVAFSVSGSQSLTFDGPFGDVQLNAWVDLSAFDGEVSLLHHQSDGQGGAFVVSTTGRARLVDRSPDPTELDAAPLDLAGRHALAVNVAGSHLKGLVDGQTVTHGHAPAHPSGAVGIRFDGEGVVAIERVEIIPIGTP